MSNRKLKFTVMDIAVLGILIALEIIFKTYFQISVWNMKIGFAFLPVAIAARRYGVPFSVMIAVIGDIMGVILVPTGPFFPGFTVTAALTATCTALFIHKKFSIPRLISYVLINEIFGTVLINTFWIHYVYGAPFWGLMPTRLFEAVVMTVVEILLMSIIFTKLDNAVNKQFK